MITKSLSVRHPKWTVWVAAIGAVLSIGRASAQGVGRAVKVELSDVGRNSQKAYIILSRPSVYTGLMRVYFSMRGPYKEKRGAMYVSGFKYYSIFTEMFDTYIAIEVDPGQFEVWMGDVAASRGFAAKVKLAAGERWKWNGES